jgi:hypothetical protein
VSGCAPVAAVPCVCEGAAGGVPAGSIRLEPASSAQGAHWSVCRTTVTRFGRRLVGQPRGEVLDMGSAEKIGRRGRPAS